MDRTKLARVLGVSMALLAFLNFAFAATEPSAETLTEARALITRSRYLQADTLCRRALAALPLHSRADSLAAGALLDLLAESCWRRTSAVPPDADSVSRRGVELRTALHGEASLERAASLTHRARVLRKFGRTQESIGIMRAVLAAQASAGASDSALAVSEAATARMFAELGSLDSAQTFDLRALDRRQSALGARHVDVGKSYNSVALNYARAGRMADARDYYERARQVFMQAHVVDSTALLRVDENLTGALLAIGHGREAYPIAMEAVAIARQRGGESPLNENLAAALWEVDKHDSAQFVYEQVIQQYSATGQWSDEARARMMLADRLARLAPSDVALAHALRSDSLCRDHSAKGALRAEVCIVLADILANRGQFAAARIAADSAVAACRATLSGEQPATVRATHNAGWMRFVEGDAGGALALELESCRHTIDHLRLWYRAMSEDETNQYDLRMPPLGYAIAASLVEAAPREPDVAALWNVAIESRSFVLNEMARRRWAVAGRSRAADSLALERRNVTRTLAGMLLTGTDQRSADAARVEALRTRASALERSLAAEVRPWLEREEAQEVDAAAIERALAPGQSFVAYTVFQRWRADSVLATAAANAKHGFASLPAFERHARWMLAAFVQRRGAAPEFVVLGDLGEIERATDSYHAALESEVTQPDAGSARSARLGIGLRRRIWDPIAQRIGDAREVVVVPDGPVLRISLSALPDDHGRYLIESVPPIVLFDTERAFVLPPGEHRPGSGLFAIGGPDFEHGPTSNVAVAPSADRSALRAVTGDCGSSTRARFAQLPSAANEVLGVRRLWQRLNAGAGSSDVRCVIGAEASEEEFKAHAGRAGVVHVATHSFAFRGDCSGKGSSAPSDPLLRTGLVLAGANRIDARRSPGEDGWLTAAEIATLDLSNNACVVLSACKSAAGATRYGEGVFGLRRALTLAGAGSTVLSLWSIDDLAASRWMRFFYEARWAGSLPPQQAVRAASLALLRERRGQGRSTSPAFWGPFVASGGVR